MTALCLSHMLQIFASIFFCSLFSFTAQLPYPDFSYGYRYGFSRPELEKLRDNADLLDKINERSATRPHFSMPEKLKEGVHGLFQTVIHNAEATEEERERLKKAERDREMLRKVVDGKSSETVKQSTDPLGQRNEKPGARGR